MPGDRSKGGPRGINWLAVRTFYFSAPTVTYADCSKRFDVSERNVARKAVSEHWRELREQHIIEAGEQLRDVAVEEVAQALRAHTKATGGLLGLVQKLIDDIETNGYRKADGEDVTSTMSQVNILLTLSHATARAVEVDRSVRGLKEGEASSNEDDAGEWTLVHRVEGVTPAPEPKKA